MNGELKTLRQRTVESLLYLRMKFKFSKYRVITEKGTHLKSVTKVLSHLANVFKFSYQKT